jgi:hypothetical protein
MKSNANQIKSKKVNFKITASIKKLSGIAPIQKKHHYDHSYVNYLLNKYLK